LYSGFLAFGDTVVIDNHMTQEWAATLGIHWLRGCTSCAGLAPRDRQYVTPLKDSGKPPWWDGSQDAMSFLGVYGLAIEGADDSMRDVRVQESISDGGYVGARRYRTRTLTVRALAIAESDCSLGFGLAWMHTLDTTAVCADSSVTMYECCPCVCGPGCDDPNCQQSCVVRYQRELRRCRITSGPTVLQRRVLPSGGAMAEVEFQIVAQDPHYYRPAVPFTFSTGSAFPVTDVLDPAPPTDDPTDPWATPVESNPWAIEPEPVRTEWLRTEQPLPLPDGFRDPLIAPEVVVAADMGAADEVRVTLWDGPIQRAAFIVPYVPAGASVRVDLGARRVFTEWNGVERSNSAFISGVTGGPFFWPGDIPATDLLVTIDRAPHSPPVTVSVTLTGSGAA
jgi:hypothetical protein